MDLTELFERDKKLMMGLFPPTLYDQFGRVIPLAAPQIISSRNIRLPVQSELKDR